LATEFATGLMRLKIRPPLESLEIYPFQLLTVEELEQLQPYIQERDFDIFDCVRSKVTEDPDDQLGLWEFITTKFLQPMALSHVRTRKSLGGLNGWQKLRCGESTEAIITTTPWQGEETRATAQSFPLGPSVVTNCSGMKL
jgi:hypothetical protein